MISEQQHIAPGAVRHQTHHEAPAAIAMRCVPRCGLLSQSSGAIPCTTPALWPERLSADCSWSPWRSKWNHMGNLIAALGLGRSQPGQCDRQLQACEMDGHCCCCAWPSTSHSDITDTISSHHVILYISIYIERDVYMYICRLTGMPGHPLFSHLPSCPHLLHPTPSQGFLWLRCPQEWPTDKQHLL